MTHQPSKICPYPGLRAFEEEESLYFKGRERPIDEIMEKLAANKFLLLTGASGDGKSSLIFAGLVPNCRAGFFKAKFNNWAIVTFRPERTPLRNLAVALAPHLVNSASSTQSAVSTVENSLKYGYSALIDLYKESSLYSPFRNSLSKGGGVPLASAPSLSGRAGVGLSNLLIIVDQFEEFFTNPENFNRETSTATESTQVMGSLLLETARLAQEQDIPIYIVCTMRSDYLGQCAALSGFPEKIEGCLFYLPRLKRQDIVQVIKEPATLSGNSISERLIQRLLNDTHAGIDILPVLQHCLHRIWLAADKGNEQMDLIHYAMVGGISKEQLPKEDKEQFEQWYEQQSEIIKKQLQNSGLPNVLNTHANELYETTNNEQATTDKGQLTTDRRKFIIETTFKCLTKIDDNRAIRNLMTINEITEMVGKDKYTIDQVAEVIKPFRMHGNTFIRPFITDETSTLPTGQAGINQQASTVLDITHEALIRNWKRLDDWAWEEHQNVQTYREFRAQLDKWLKNNRKKEHLMSIGSLNYFGTWFKAQKTDPLTWLKRYMWEDEEVEDTEIPPMSQKLSRSVFDEKAVEHLADIREYLNLSRKNIARKTRFTRIAVTAICILLVLVSFAWFQSEKLNKLISRTKHANETATKAYLKLESDPTLAFRLAEQAYKIHPTNLAKQVIMSSYGKMPFYQLLKGNQLVKFSPDGKYIITVSGSIARLWDRKGNELQIFNKMHGRYFNNHHFVNFSFKSQYMGLVKSDSTALIYDISHNKKHVLKGHTDHVKSIYFSSDNRFILTASDDKTISMWDMNFNKIQVLKGHMESVRFAKFSPDSKYILSASDDNTVRLWDAAGNLLKVLRDVKFGEKYDANFSPDGNHVIITSYDNISRLWNIRNNEVTLLKGHTDIIWSAYFSPDGKYILTSSIDNTARLWDLQGNELLVYKEHTAKLWDAKFSPDGKQIISISDDCTAHLWDLQGHTLQILKGHASQLYDVNFSPDGKHVATAALDGTARIWNIKPKENSVLRGHFSWLEDANFSPDGNYIVTAGYDYVARIWNRQGHHIRALKGHQHYYMRTAKFSPDGKYIVTSSGDKTARLWNLEGEELVVFKGHTSRVGFADFSSDGKYLLTKSWDGIKHLWDLKGNEIKVFNNVTDANFSPKENLLVTISKDTVFRVYKLPGKGIRDSLLLLQKYNLPALSSTVEFSPDGNYLVTIANDSTAGIWEFNTSTTDVLQLIKQIENKNAPISFLKFSKDSKYFITTSEDNIGYIYDLHGKQIQILVGHSDDIISAEFSPDCKFIVTGSSDFTVRVWDMQGKELQVLPGHTSTVMKVCFSNDGNYVLSASIDQTARLMPWRVEDVLHKINEEKVRGEVWELSEEDMALYGIVK